MRILVKIGSTILTSATHGLNRRRIASLARDVAKVKQAGHDVLLVSSGAVAAGMQKMGLRRYPHDIRIKQAVAAIGQSSLMWAYEKYFAAHGTKVAQILLTRDDFKNRIRYINAKNTLDTLLEFGFIPVVNENDPVSVDEIKFGDNDQLAALVAGMLSVNRMVILSDVDGLYDRDPVRSAKARIVREVQEVSDDVLALAEGATSQVGTGGMLSKLLAARMATAHGIPVHIINGRKAGTLARLVDGGTVGTTIRPATGKRLTSRKGWIAYSRRCRGTLHLDDGAVRAVVKGGKSLLPSGVVRTEGDFKKGDAVECVNPAGERIAKGLVNYPSDEIRILQKKKTSQIKNLLGYKYSDEVIHRDNLVVDAD